MDASQVVFLLGVLALTAVAAVLDARWKRLPNVLTVTAFALGLVFNVVRGAMTDEWLGAGRGLLFGVAGFAVGFGALLILWLIGGGGGGDVKFMGALGAWLGPRLTVEVLIAATVLAGLFSLFVSVREFVRIGPWRGLKRQRAAAHDGDAKRGAASGRRRTRRQYVPFGVPVAVATWVLLVSAWIVGWPKLPL